MAKVVKTNLKTSPWCCCMQYPGPAILEVREDDIRELPRVFCMNRTSHLPTTRPPARPGGIAVVSLRRREHEGFEGSFVACQTFLTHFHSGVANKAVSPIHAFPKEPS